MRSPLRRAALAVLLCALVQAPRATASQPDGPAHESLPALARDDAGSNYLAVVSRSAEGSAIVVSRVAGGERVHLATLGSGRAPGRPALAGLADGVLLAFSATDAGNRHRVHYATIRPGVPYEVRAVDEPGTRSILPAVARAKGTILLVWETNASGPRTIRAATIRVDGTHSPPQTISSPSASANNPDVVVLDDGTAFAAWDSFRDGNWDVYGARWRGGRWAAEVRVTSDPRLERHPSVASAGGKLWLAWQAESFPGNRSLSLVERRVLLGRLWGNGALSGEVWEMTPAHVRKPLRQSGPIGLTRPHLRPGGDGRLWLSARQSLGMHAGWAVIVRDYRDRWWGPAQVLLEEQGRWPEAPFVATGERLVAAVQKDRHGASFQEEHDHEHEKPDASEVSLVEFGPLEPGRATVARRMPRTRFDAAARVARSNANAPRPVRTWRDTKLALYWGNLHAHSALSTCNRAVDPPPEDLLVLERDLDRLDFCALTDHDFSLDHPSWAYTQEAVARYEDPGFTTLLGQEWTSGNVAPARPDERPVVMRYGHHNIIFRSPDASRVVDSSEAGTRSPAEIAAALGEGRFVLIPHGLADWQFAGLANPPVDWTSVDRVRSPLAEIYQRRGSYECLGCPRQAPRGAPFRGRYLRDAWQQGVVIGTIAAPDHGGGEGYAGVWAADVSDESLFVAFHQRHTFGTTGEKTALFFSAGDAMMGDEVERDAEGAIDLEVWAASDTPIEQVVVFRNGDEAFRAAPNAREASVRWRDEKPGRERVWYYARVHAAPGTPAERHTRRLAWSSPIWFGEVRAARAGGGAR